MKKILVALVAFGLTLSAFAATVTNRGEVITVTTYDDMQAATENTNDVTLVAGYFVTLLDRNDADFLAADAREYVAEGPGQLLIGLSAIATSQVYMATGWGTNNWILISK